MTVGNQKYVDVDFKYWEKVVRIYIFCNDFFFLFETTFSGGNFCLSKVMFSNLIEKYAYLAPWCIEFSSNDRSFDQWVWVKLQN